MKDIKISIQSLLFFLSYSLYIIYEILMQSFYAKYIDRFSKYIIAFCIILLILKELNTKKIKIRDFAYLLICLAMSFILFKRYSNGTRMLPLFLFIYSARTIELKKIAKYTILVDIFLLFFIICSAKIGIIYDYIEYGTRTRDYIGFRYSLPPQILTLNITLLVIYLVQTNNKKIWVYILLILFDYYIYRYTNSRLSFYQAIGLIVILIIFQRKNKIFFPKIFKFISIFSFIICAILSFYLTYNYNFQNDNYRKLNEILGNRLYYGKKSFETYDINLWGNNVQFVGNGLSYDGEKSELTYNYVDNFYINMIEKYGIIYFLIFNALFTISIITAYRRNDNMLILILVSIAIHGLIDDLILYLYFNTFYFSISYSINDFNEYIDKRNNKKKI